MRDERQEALRAAIDELYDVFSRHPMAERGHFVGCGPSEEDADILSTTPLREIPWEPLERMSSGYRHNNGMRPFRFEPKHFLPRALELVSEDLGRAQLLGRRSTLGQQVADAMKWGPNGGPALHRWAVALLDLRFNTPWDSGFGANCGAVLSALLSMGMPSAEIIRLWSDIGVELMEEQTRHGESLLLPRAPSEITLREGEAKRLDAFHSLQEAMVQRQLNLLGQEDRLRLVLWPIRLDEELQRFEYWATYELADQSPDPYRHARALRIAVSRTCELPGGGRRIEGATARLSEYTAPIFFELLADHDHDDWGEDDYQCV